MNEPIQLSSTMSPRVKVKNNFNRKGPTFLALPQALKRRSSNVFKRTLKPIKDAIIIESSTESDNSCDSAKLNNSHKSVERTAKETNRFRDIQQWINDIEVIREDPMAFNELSTILGDSNCIPKERGDVVNSTFEWDKCKKINEFFIPKSNVQRLNNSDVISDSDRSLSDASLKNLKLHKSSDNKTEPGRKQNISSKENNDLHNVSSSDKKSIDRFVESSVLNKSKNFSDVINITSTSEEKSIDKLMEEIDLNKSSKNLGDNDLIIPSSSNEKSKDTDSNKSKCLDDTDIINITSSLEEEYIDRLLKNIDLNTPNRLDVSEAYKHVTLRKKIPRNAELLSDVSVGKENRSLCKVLGNSWSTTSKKAIEPDLPKTEPRPRNHTERPKDTCSEKQSKTSPLYKNPYLDREESLRRNLFKTKLNSVQESSLTGRIKKLCDSKSDSKSSNSDSDKEDSLSFVESSYDEIITKSIRGENCSITSRKTKRVVSPKTEPTSQKLIIKLKKQSKTSPSHKNSYLDSKKTEPNSLQQNLFKTKTKLFRESSLTERIRNSCDSGSDSKSASGDSDPDEDDLVSSIESSDEEIVTKSIEGDSCSTTSRKAIIEPILPNTEPRPRNVPKNTKDAHSEKQSKASPLYKNPYLDREDTNWNSIRQNLFKTRRKSVQESSLTERIKKLCDSETDSEPTISDSDSDKHDLLSPLKSSAEIGSKSTQGNSCPITSKKVVEPILPKTEPRPRKLVRKPEDTYVEKESRSSPLYKNPYLDRGKTESDIMQQNSSETNLKLSKEARLVKLIEELHVAESDSDNSDSEPDKCDLPSNNESSNDENITKPVQEHIQDVSELESILDEAYGPAWRKNRDRILPKTEPRPRTYRKDELPNDPIYTERKLETAHKDLRDPLFQDVRKKLFDTPELTPKVRSPQFKELVDEKYDFKTSRAVWKGAQKKKSYTFLESLSASVPIDECDPSARIFRANFKNLKDKLRQKLHDLYNVRVFDSKLSDVNYIWSNKYLNTAGSCKYKMSRRLPNSVTIVLAEKVIDSPERLRDTLIHEMCHAATWLIDHVLCNHGKYWKAWTYKAMKTFKELPPIQRCHSYRVNYKYNYKCQDCGYSLGRHTKSVNVEEQQCHRCGGRYELYINRKGKNNEVKVVRVAPTPKKPLTPFALFVKENYAAYKSPGVSHAQVMQVLGSKFREEKVNK